MDNIVRYIKQIEAWLSKKEEETPFYMMYGRSGAYIHDREIKTKALAFWKRAFNRRLEKIKY